MLRRQAKVLRPRELDRLLLSAARGRNPERDQVMILLAFKAGLRAKEIASLTWSMVTDASGEVADHLALTDHASKGRHGGRIIPMHADLKAALGALNLCASAQTARPHHRVIYSERGDGYTPNGIAVWFHTRSKELGIEGGSSHSGRRTFITSAARKIVEAGGSLRDVQELAGHSSLATTQRYIEGDSAAKRKLITLI